MTKPTSLLQFSSLDMQLLLRTMRNTAQQQWSMGWPVATCALHVFWQQSTLRYDKTNLLASILITKHAGTFVFYAKHCAAVIDGVTSCHLCVTWVLTTKCTNIWWNHASCFNSHHQTCSYFCERCETLRSSSDRWGDQSLHVRLMCSVNKVH